VGIVLGGGDGWQDEDENTYPAPALDVPPGDTYGTPAVHDDLINTA